MSKTDNIAPRAIDPSPDLRRYFVGEAFSHAQMAEANRDDPGFLEWLDKAAVGETFTDGEGCTRLPDAAMSTITSPEFKPAAVAFDATADSIDAKIKELASWCASLDSDTANWAHVGDLVRVRDLLAEAVKIAHS